jgi:hypothetical protein
MLCADAGFSAPPRLGLGFEAKLRKVGLDAVRLHVRLALA